MIVPSITNEAKNIVFNYGVRIDAECQEALSGQYFKAHKLYNEIVAVIRDTINNINAFVHVHSGEFAGSLKQEIDLLNEDFKHAKHSDNELRMKEIATQRREKQTTLWEIYKKVRKEKSATIKTMMRAIGNSRTCETYKRYAHAKAQGLGWGTAGFIHESVLNAFSKKIKTWQVPHFKKISGVEQSTLVVQYPVAGGMDINSLIFASDEKKGGHFWLVPPKESGQKKYGEFGFLLGASKNRIYATGTIKFHRDFPEGARVLAVRLVRRKHGIKFKYNVQFVLSLPKEYQVEVSNNRKPSVVVHYGWESDENGKIIAGVADCENMGKARLIQIPADIEADLNCASEIQSQRDLALNDLLVVYRKSELVSIAKMCDEERGIYAAVLKIAQTKDRFIKPTMMHWLCGLMRHLDYSIPSFLEEWRAKDKLMWQSQIGIAKRARNRRKKFYEYEAIMIAREHHSVVINKPKLDEAALKVNEATGEKTDFNRSARAGRVVASLYEFDMALRWAATKCGCSVFEVKGEETVGICCSCGESYNRILQKCENCNSEQPKKINGAINAYQLFQPVREQLVEDYWHDRSFANQEKAAKKVARLKLMQEKKRQIFLAKSG